MKNGLLSFRTQKPASQYLPFSYHVTDTVISLKSLEYMSVIKVGGRSHQTTDASSIFQWIENLNTTSRTMLNEHTDIYSYVIRRDQSAYPDGEYSDYFSKSLNEKYKKAFLSDDENTLKVNELYVAIVYKPFGSDLFTGIKKSTINTKESLENLRAESVKEVNSLTDKLCNALHSYGSEVLGTYSETIPETGKEVYFSAPMEVMAYIMNGKEMRVPITKRRFASTIVNSQIKFSKRGELAIRKTATDTDLVGICELNDYDNNTWPGQLDYLLETDFPFVLTNSFTAVSDRSAMGFLKNHKKFMIETGDVGVSQIRDIDNAMDELISGRFCMGLHHCTAMVYAKDIKTVKSRMEAISDDLSKHGLIFKPVTKALEAAFWAQFPSNRKYRPRAKPITSLNFWCFSSFHNFMTGKLTGNPWGNAITGFKTDSKTPFYLNLHETPLKKDSVGKRPAGHTGIFGKTGSGKTVVINFILSMMQKYRTNGVIFDKDRGMENFIRAAGGVYNPILWGEPTGWNPLQLEPTLKNVYFIKEFIADLAVSGSSRELTSDDIEEISTAVDAVMTKATKEERRLDRVMEILPVGDDNRESVHKLLIPWVTGDYKWVFNNRTDNLSLGRGYYGFDTSSFLDKKQVRIPILKYLIHRGDEMIDGSPFLYCFEECWNLCEDQFFLDLIKDKLKTIRKNNGLVVFSTQEPNDVLSSPIGKTFASSLATVICTRNDKAKAEDYKILELSDVEINLIKGMEDNDHRFIVKQGNMSAVARFDLDEFKDEMSILSGSEDTANIVIECIKEFGDTPQIWVPKFYERMRKEL